MAMSPLFTAVHNKDTARVDELLSGGASVREKRSDHYTLLADAIGTGCAELVECLLTHQADPNEISGNPRGERSSPLILAAKQASLPIVKLLLTRAVDVNLINNRGVSALRAAVSDRTQDHVRVTEALISAGANVNLDDAITPLMQASDTGNPEMVAVLLRHGAKVNTMTSSGTALRCAIESERIDNIEILLDHGADAHSVCYQGKTPLELATKVGNRKVIKLITGASTNAPVNDADTKPRSFGEILADLRRAIVEKAPQLTQSLRAGASHDALGALEKKAGVALPTELRQLLDTFDGQTSDGPALFSPIIARENFWLLAANDIARSWANLKTCLDAGDFDRAGGPDRGVREDWWHPAWIPFAHNGNSDFLCVDLAPASGGAAGQVISWFHDESKRELISPSLSMLLAEVADTL